MKHLFFTLVLVAALVGTASLANACCGARRSAPACESIAPIGVDCCSAGTIVAGSERIISVRILSDCGISGAPIIIGDPPVFREPLATPPKAAPAKKMPYAK